MYLEGVLGATPDAIVTLDAHHRIVEWNAGAERLFGYSRQEVIGQSLDPLVTNPDTFEEAAGFTQTVMSGKDLPPVETIRYRKDGSPVDVIAAGFPILVGNEFIGVVAVYTDITARKQAEEALRELNATLETQVAERTAELRTQYARLDAILRSATDGIAVTNEEGSIVQSNPVAQTWLTQTLSPEEAGRLREAVQSVARQACAEETRLRPEAQPEWFSGKNPVSLLELTGLDLELSAAPILEPEVTLPPASGGLGGGWKRRRW